VDYEITDTDLSRECKCIPNQDPIQALRRLIDRCLLLNKAVESGYSVSDDEFDVALLELIEEEEPFGLPAGSLQDLDAQEMETLLTRNILIRKYIQDICNEDDLVSENKLKEVYEEQREKFCSEEMVRCSHILIKGGDDALAKILELRKQINSPEDFIAYSSSCSDCPSNSKCGDLGFFSRGKLIPEIDEVAFSLSLGEISHPFKSKYGYHLLLLTDRKCSSPVPFEEIKTSLAARIRQLEKEYFLMRHVSDLYLEYKDRIVILSDAYKQA
ncbi:MAG TPA: peptidylprolyl isomerase, partial [Candidatus Cloacimonadota bacterium]|nr:peptidylprolyl isomerase [Candidatus Cloacimonadota bacterium]